MKFDILGRINNMRLPDGKTAVLYSVYEAVSNSIHAINDRFSEEKAASNGVVDVEVETDEDGDVDTITVTDNGIGFTEANLRSFETSDSRFKYKRGGKGVGRFIWIKMFETIKVETVVKKGRSVEGFRFNFAPEKANSIAYRRSFDATGEDTGSTITLTDLRTEQRGRIRVSSYLKDLSLHFFPQYISGTLPEVNITVDGELSNLNEFIKEHVETPVEQVLQVDFGDGKTELKVSHLFVESSISTGLRNAYLLTAHGRLVGDPVSIERKYGLKELPNGKAYVSVVSSPFLDERVDQERLGFKLTTVQQEILQKAILGAAEDFLADHIGTMRSRQRKTVETLIIEHPQLATQIESVPEYVETLSPGMDDEQIGQNLFVLLYREERDLRTLIDKLSHLDTLDSDVRAQAQAALDELENQEKHRLAELVVKRHQVLQMANILLKYKDESKKIYAHERVIHDLICPMGEMYGSGDYHRHNLWILDDALASYGFFASDKSIASLAKGAESTKEPDLVFFNPLGFRREGTDEPVAIVEFKRPGDERTSQDPLSQVLGYIDDLRSASERDVDGGVISNITDRTAFDCIIICELTEPVRRKLKGSLAQNPTPDGEGFYGYSREHNATIRVVSFQKMIRDAEIRNRVFFESLKLGSPSVAAKNRAARARAKRAA